MYDSYDYDEDYEEFENNPLISPEQIESMKMMHAISDGTAYEKYGFDPDGRHEREAEEKLIYKPGIHTRSFTGTSKGVEVALDKFNKKMQEKYPTYEIKELAPVQLTNGTCLYLMFRV